MSSGFVTEKEIEESRKARQEEWERVRTADQPLEAPEETHDYRSLYDRLEEQKQKKQLEYEEAHKLKNMIKGLDDDEVDFLDFVDRKKIENEQIKEREERKELLEFRKNVEKLRESNLEERIQAEIRPTKINAPNTSANRSQHKLLKGVVVKRKSEDAQTVYTESKRTCPQPKKSPATTPESPEESSPAKKRGRNNEDDSDHENSVTGLTCVGILPGLGSYDVSSDSDSDSSCDSGKKPCAFDMLGRKFAQHSKEKKQTNV